MAPNRYAFATRAVHGGGGPGPTTGAVAAVLECLDRGALAQALAEVG